MTYAAMQRERFHDDDEEWETEWLATRRGLRTTRMVGRVCAAFMWTLATLAVVGAV